MKMRAWLWVATALDLLLLLPAFYMAIAAADIAQNTNGSPAALIIAAFFLMLPVFCIAAPLAGWRALARDAPAFHIGALFAAPWIYAAFLVILLIFD